MDYSTQTMNIVNTLKNLPPDIVAQDRLNIAVQQDLHNGKEYIVIWLNETER